MRKYITLFFSASFFLSSCGGKSTGGIIEHNKMVSLLTDVHILDGSIYNLKQDPDSLYKYGTGKYLSLFKRYQVDSVEFRASLKYYSTQPQEMLEMYDQVLANIQQKTDSINKVLQKQYAVPKK